MLTDRRLIQALIGLALANHYLTNGGYMYKLHFYEDPGHGWLKVPKALLRVLDIEDQISWYSYQKGDFAYLEEDCDYSLFQAAMNQTGREFSLVEHCSRERSSKIRSYEHYRYAAAKCQFTRDLTL